MQAVEEADKGALQDWGPLVVVANNEIGFYRFNTVKAIILGQAVIMGLDMR